MPTFVGRFLYRNTGIMGLGAGFAAGLICLAVITATIWLTVCSCTRTYFLAALLHYIGYLWYLSRRTPKRPTEAALEGVNEEYDVVVVGYGAAGAAAALEAADRGLKVVILERFGGGGATTRSGGVYYAGGGTALQHQLGVEDSPENMFRYLKQEMDGAVPDLHLRVFAEASRGDVEFLLRHNVAVGRTEGALLFDFHKTSHPPNGYSLYYSGSETANPFCKVAKPAHRGHLAVPTKDLPASAVGTGCVMFGGLQQACAKNANITVRIQTAAKSLVRDKQGQVVGVHTVSMDGVPWGLLLLAELAEALGSCMKPPQLKPCDAFAQWTINKIENAYGSHGVIGCSRGVVLCAGGFGANLRMVKEHCPQYAGCMPLGTLADDGSGIALGTSVGGVVHGMGRGSAWKFTYPPEAFLKTVQVGMDGRRLGNEDVYGARLTANMVRAGGEAWLVMDHKLWEEARVEVHCSKTMVVFQQMFCYMNLYANRKKAATLDELARQCGIPADAFRATMKRYNADCDKGEDAEFGKAPKLLSPIRQAPFYAIRFAAASTLWMTPFLTLGGLKVDFESGRLLDKEGQCIDGVYAAGRTASGIPATSYVSGLSIADCVFSGRRAARHCHLRGRKKADGRAADGKGDDPASESLDGSHPLGFTFVDAPEASGLPEETLHLLQTCQ